MKGTGPFAVDARGHLAAAPGAVEVPSAKDQLNADAVRR
jgi:hypothetical protein